MKTERVLPTDTHENQPARINPDMFVQGTFGHALLANPEIALRLPNRPLSLLDSPARRIFVQEHAGAGMLPTLTDTTTIGDILGSPTPPAYQLAYLTKDMVEVFRVCPQAHVLKACADIRTYDPLLIAADYEKDFVTAMETLLGDVRMNPRNRHILQGHFGIMDGIRHTPQEIMHAHNGVYTSRFEIECAIIPQVKRSLPEIVRLLRFVRPMTGTFAYALDPQAATIGDIAAGLDGDIDDIASGDTLLTLLAQPAVSHWQDEQEDTMAVSQLRTLARLAMHSTQKHPQTS